jgi:tRNA modification GTPase
MDQGDAARDTIFALASGRVRAAISVIRISGPQARAIAMALAGRVPPARRATLARLRDPQSDETLDHALVLFFDGAASEIGEDGLELHLHGSLAVVDAVLEVLGRQPGARPAEPGEFARRAFARGKLDLTQLEALADLIEAETAWQRRQAQRQLSGAMRAAIAPWRAALIAAAAETETAIDFAEDVGLDASVHRRVAGLIAPLRTELREELARAPSAERVREGVQIVIAGPPNAGKSSLLNALVQREAAIVSTEAGTTRDPIEVHLNLGGCLASLVDTAGLRDSGDTIEQIGIARARARADKADLVLWLADPADAPPRFDAPVWRLAAKADLRVPPAATADDALPISATTGLNLDRLLERLVTFAQDQASAGLSGLLVRARHRNACAVALEALDQIATTPDLPVELMAEELRRARFALDRLIGAVDVEDILGDVFSRFCIGK